MKCHVALLCCLAAFSCRCSEPTPPHESDAAVALPRADPTIDETTGLQIQIGPDWLREPIAPGHPRLVDARYQPAKKRPIAVAPRIVVRRIEAPRTKDPNLALLDAALAETKATLKKTGDATIKRTARSHWYVGSTEVAAFELRYTVRHPSGEPGAPGTDVIHRTAVLIAPETQGAAYDITATFLASESLDAEIDRIFRSLVFSPRGSQ